MRKVGTRQNFNRVTKKKSIKSKSATNIVPNRVSLKNHEFISGIGNVETYRKYGSIVSRPNLKAKTFRAEENGKNNGSRTNNK